MIFLSIIIKVMVHVVVAGIIGFDWIEGYGYTALSGREPGGFIYLPQGVAVGLESASWRMVFQPEAQ